MGAYDKPKNKIAICDDAIEFQGNRIFDKDWAKYYRGALSIAFLAELLNSRGYAIATGDIAVENVQVGYWKPDEILVIQEKDAAHGEWLIRRGAKPSVLKCYESPGYATRFYDQLEHYGPIFKHRILFSGAFRLFRAEQGKNHIMRYPSFDDCDLQPLREWNARELLVMVAANRWYSGPYFVPFSTDPKNYLRWFRRMCEQRTSAHKKLALNNELHTKRLEAIEYFGQAGAIRVFGGNWDAPHRIPPNWRKRISPILAKLNPKVCDNKLETIASFKFSICFENISFPGYITEKIIDCFVAGTIPVYLGAPDISEFIPREAFVDLRDFDSWPSLHRYLLDLDEQDAVKMIQAGRDFLASTAGAEYRYSAHTGLLWQCIKDTS